VLTSHLHKGIDSKLFGDLEALISKGEIETLGPFEGSAINLDLLVKNVPPDALPVLRLVAQHEEELSRF